MLLLFHFFVQGPAENKKEYSTAPVKLLLVALDSSLLGIWGMLLRTNDKKF